MQPSIFNLRVPLPERGEVFLMNTLSDAQLLVSADVDELLQRVAAGRLERVDTLDATAREAIDTLTENGFLVEGRDADQRNLDGFFTRVKHDRSELHITLLTTLQCNFSCDYCFQGDHGDYNKFAEKMSMETAAQTADWMERELDRVHPQKLTLMFFGGEPLLNLPVMYYVAERMSAATQARGVAIAVNIITNGLLLTPDVVDRMLPWGLQGIKITLDGDRETHDRMRPLRGGQGTFDRIVENVRAVAGKVNIGISGNFDETSADSIPALLDYLQAQDFADKLLNVNFKPIIRNQPARPSLKGVLPLIPVSAGADKPLNGTCMTNVGKGGGAGCASHQTLDDHMSRLRDETRSRGFSTPDGVHAGPCHIHYTHAQTIGPDGSLYACPGFTGEKALSTGHIDGRADARRETERERFERLHPWSECGDCAFIPVCAGGCVMASHAELGDMNLPTCHKPSFESALKALARNTAANAA